MVGGGRARRLQGPGVPSGLGWNDQFPVFRYDAKAGQDERPKAFGVAHATVIPLSLMRWLINLLTPVGGVVLEPFAGSGSTIQAALMDGFRVVAVEKDPAYLPLIRSRLDRADDLPV